MGRVAQADNANGNGSACIEVDAEICTETGEGQKSFAALKSRGAQAHNENGSAPK